MGNSRSQLADYSILARALRSQGKGQPSSGTESPELEVGLYSWSAVGVGWGGRGEREGKPILLQKNITNLLMHSQANICKYRAISLPPALHYSGPASTLLHLSSKI